MSEMTTRATVASRASRALANRSWVSGRSGVSPWSRIAIELASHGPIQIGRYRSRAVSLRITTWRLESMWTRTLSTTISTSPSSMAGLSHGRWGGRRRRGGRSMAPGGHEQHDPGHDGADHEATDVGEERNAATALDGAERGRPVDQLEDEPEAQNDDRRHVDELVEEAE